MREFRPLRLPKSVQDCCCSRDGSSRLIWRSVSSCSSTWRTTEARAWIKLDSSPAPSSPRKMTAVGGVKSPVEVRAHTNRARPRRCLQRSVRHAFSAPCPFGKLVNYGHLILHFCDGATRISGLDCGRRTRAANPRLSFGLASFSVAASDSGSISRCCPLPLAPPSRRSARRPIPPRQLH